ncbi:MAG TPA: sigma factor-like helix-turn-helix DNA-binding protein, partial [Ktedonobacteraceae bacterium]
WQEVEAYERFALSDVWEQAWSSVKRASLHACLKQLPTEQRTIIELAYFWGWTHGEIAQRCQIPLGTVKTRLRLGVLHLRRALEQRGIKEETPSGNTSREKARPAQAATVVVQETESACASGYELCRDGSCGCFRYTEWERLLEQIEVFEFRGTAGSFIARKERRAHGHAYWYAYTWGSAGRRKTYLGRSAAQTLARLEAMAKMLYQGERVE